MRMDQKIEKVQHYLKENHLDGWLLYDFRRSNELACRFLEIPSTKLITRRYFYWIPDKGTPVKIVHQIEHYLFDHLPGELATFAMWKQLELQLAVVLEGKKNVAMEYSPKNALPYVSKVDGGTLDLVRSFGVDVVSSADLLQQVAPRWTSEQLSMHLKAAEILELCVESTWKHISESFIVGTTLTEYDVQQYMLQLIQSKGAVTDGGPICAVNENSANPHYEAQPQKASKIHPGDWILIDLWCKLDLPNAVYADITRVAVALPEPTAVQQQIFSIVKRARDRATEFVRFHVAEGKSICGWEVDEICRDVIEAQGYGSYFTHRTGHNIDINDHGDGAHIDNFETHDVRSLIPGTCFSIEPGIYLPGDFGVRLEYDVYIDNDRNIQITGGIQEEIECLVSS